MSRKQADVLRNRSPFTLFVVKNKLVSGYTQRIEKLT